MKIDLGGGTKPATDHINLDPVHGEGDWRRSATDTPWPTPDQTVTHIVASHVMEHIPAGAPRLTVMNECHRVLAPGGVLHIIVPLVGSWQAIADPTHVSFWVPESFWYFDGKMAPNAEYGNLPWRTLDWHVEHDWEGHWLATPIR